MKWKHFPAEPHNVHVASQYTNLLPQGAKMVEHKNSIVLAMFGTTVESGLAGLLNIRAKMEAAFPQTLVQIAFTSAVIRKTWQQRAQDAEYRTAHPEIPKTILKIKGVLATLAELQEQGHDTVILQPVLMTMGEEYLDLATYPDALLRLGSVKKSQYKPFHKIILGRPALGRHGADHPHGRDVMAAAEALAADAGLAARQGAALVYMGHGNSHFPAAGSYLELEARMEKLYPETLTAIGNVEGFPSLDEVMTRLNRFAVRKVLLKPCMVVAGCHALADMAGTGRDSWKNVLEKNGLAVQVIRQGLGEQDEFADIYVNHVAEAAADAGIILQ
jgi:sirohydrochlorin cobaltochelatase